MSKLIGKFSWHLTSNRLTLAGTAVLITFAVFSLGGLNHFLSTILQGSYYVYYQIVFLPLMFLAFQLYLKLYLATPMKSFKLIIFGVLTGYVASLLASDLELFFVPYGWQRFLNSTRTVADWDMRFFRPIWALGWFFGCLMAMIIILLLRCRGKELSK